MNPDLSAMFTVDKPGNYMVVLKGVELDTSKEYFKYHSVHLIPLDDMIREIEEERRLSESNYYSGRTSGDQ